MSNVQDSFICTFQQQNSFERTAAFFLPENQPILKKSNYFRQRSPKGDYEIKQVFSGKPRSPSTKNKNYNQVNSPGNSFINQSPLSRDNEMDDYFLQPYRKTSEIKQRIPFPQVKKQFSHRNKLPTLPKDIKLEMHVITDFHTTLSNSQSMLVLHDPSKDRNKFKINLNQTTDKNNESSVQPSSDQGRYANKDNTIMLNKILKVKVNKKENKAALNITQKENWADFGICCDQKEVLKTVIKNPQTKKIDEKIIQEEQYQRIKPQSSPQRIIIRQKILKNSSSPGFQNNIKPARTFLQKKQQMAILNKLFSRNASK